VIALGVRRYWSFATASVEGWSHYDLYDKPEPVGQALAKLIPFYKEQLGSSKVAKKAA
jgi:hypothetical protein